MSDFIFVEQFSIGALEQNIWVLITKYPKRHWGIGSITTEKAGR